MHLHTERDCFDGYISNCPHNTNLSPYNKIRSPLFVLFKIINAVAKVERIKPEILCEYIPAIKILSMQFMAFDC